MLTHLCRKTGFCLPSDPPIRYVIQSLPNTDMELEGQTALVTGAGRGIGRAIALTLAGAGADVVVLARSRNEVEAVAQEIVDAGGRGRAFVADLADAVTLTSCLDPELNDSGFDILVNNAGVLGPVGLTWDLDPEQWMAAVDVNLGGCLRCTRACLPEMIARGRGKIVNISGGGAVSPRPRFTAYGASKAAIVRFTETLALELAEHRIDVNAVAPGAINTRMTRKVVEAGSAAGDEEAQARKQLAEGGESVQSAAELILYLSSPRSDGLSGRLLSAVWDPWDELDVAAVMDSEKYTVRRVKL
ncbi:MAG: SDR family NAD(P)-dependent oxidoreductase [Candidatus Latescibacterota bacterium]|nr:SDR family NAD(P)-dependent oxidoreductase [Candidatus Latescibacterota bacterium]